MFSRYFLNFNQGNDVSRLESLIDRNEFEKAKQLLEKIAKNPKSELYKLSFMLYVNNSSNDSCFTKITWKLNFRCFNLKDIIFGFSEVGPQVEQSNDILQNSLC